ncbi:hypothetical protein BKP35_08490 [Anaerobacillus arseniciselenatis]|uniref:Site-specific integrase n=1 Tax=Anaerobacillus arseniciselenatis TaxID=85682 RepID=A0A1S2LQ46_9BACI|nr:tyrosine-type recombinase/integrase [Anaerobacillus arseniciselenatis]OIJ13807.1 hypothetical protein BKP35_08490 [Anaerobacillus arseniciselenatis]
MLKSLKGSIKPRGNSFQVKYDAGRHPHTGRRIQKTATFKTEKEAEQFLIEVNYKLNNGIYKVETKETFGEYFKRWFDTMHKKTVAETTAETRDCLARKHLIPRFGYRKLSEITTMELDFFYSDKIDDDYSPKTIKELHILMKKSLDQAVKWGLLQSNPALSATPPSLVPKKAEIWDYDQWDQFLEVAKAYGDEEFYTTSYFTGGRRGELLGLQWKSVDLEKKKIHIHQTLAYTKTKKLHLKEPKTKSSNRTISIGDLVVEALTKQKEKLEARKRELGDGYQDLDLVFPNSFGGFKTPRNKLREFYSLTEKAGLTRIPLHNLRHSHATNLLKEGIQPRVVQERFGHADLRTAQEIYSHVTPDIQEEAAVKGENAYNARKKKA